MSPPPPRLEPGTPEPPEGSPWPEVGARVFVDTNCAHRRDFYRVLLICAQQGFLDVCWSPWVAAELARIACRRRIEKQPPSAGRWELRDALEEARREVNLAVGEMERWWRVPGASEIRACAEQPDQPDDPDDRPVLAAARAAAVGYLLSEDSRSFGHGRSYACGGHPSGQLECWHPDTFLTTLFTSHHFVYQVVWEEYQVIWGDGVPGDEE